MSVHCNKEFIISLACYMKGLINGELTKSLCYIPTDIFAKDMFQVRKALEFKIKKKLCPGSDPAAFCDTIQCISCPMFSR